MKAEYVGFQEKRMQIFTELVKRYWKGELNNSDDLDLLAEDIREKFQFKQDDTAFIKNHIRVAMGQDPKGDFNFMNELDIVRASSKIEEPVIAKIEGPCKYCDEENCKVNTNCKYETNIYRRNESPLIVNNKCLTCGACVTACDFGAISEKIEFLPLVKFLKDAETPVFAAAAPAIVGQFGDATVGQLRTAFKLLGFQDMIEVALFADILTIKEAFDFNRLVKKEEDFFLTSCCCPVWFNMTKKNYPQIYKHMSPSVSPMIASGRILKKIYTKARIVFISPCIAKKAEVKEKELEGAIDFVINFREMDYIFKALDIHPETLPEDEKDQASFAGRVYARTGGVSFSVKTVVNRLETTRVIKLKALKVDGAKDCKQILDKLSNGEKIHANFIEGMGCKGGCVGGPRTNIDAETATKKVNLFGEDSFIMTPFDNYNVMKILKELGLESINDIIKNNEVTKLLTRN